MNSTPESDKRNSIYDRFIPGLLIEVGVMLYGLTIEKLWLLWIGAVFFVGLLAAMLYKVHHVSESPHEN